MPHEELAFSFKYYDSSEGAVYCLSKWEEPQIKEALRRLGEINTKSLLELQQQRKVLHFFPVDWTKTKKPNGFPDRNLAHLEAFHFALLGVNGQKARVFGAYQKGVFFIVWFDLNHEIWPSALRNT